MRNRRANLLRTPHPNAISGVRKRACVFRDRIMPHWFHGNTRFWYRNDVHGGAKEFVVVDAEKGTHKIPFDHAKLAAALSKATGTEFPADKLPFNRIEFVDDATAVRFSAADASWNFHLTSFECARSDVPPAGTDDESNAAPDRRGRRGPRPDGNEGDDPSDHSPDGKWTAFIEEHNVFLKARSNGDEEIQLSQDGRDGLAYGRLSWSPDSQTLIAWRIEPANARRSIWSNRPRAMAAAPS